VIATAAVRAAPALVLTLALAACGGAPAARAVMPNDGHDPTPLAKCRVSADRDAPLVTEWPASSKARLETLLHEGAVAVAYSGCEMRIIDACKPQGTYVWSRTTLSTDATTIRNEDDLYAKLPLGATSLSGELKASGSLEVRTTVAGQMKLQGGPDAPGNDACMSATHVVTALSVGAFTLVAGGAANASGGVGVAGLGAGGSSSQSEQLVRSAGDPARCADATEAAPSGECSSPIQVFLEPIRRAPAPPPSVATSGVAAPPSVWIDSPPTPREPPSRVPGFVLGGLGVVSTGVGGYFLLHASSEKSAIQNGGLATSGDIQSAADSAALSTNLGWTCLGVGVTLLLSALPLIFVGSGSSTATAPTHIVTAEAP
jgi:hypothetical protein